MKYWLGDLNMLNSSNIPLQAYSMETLDIEEMSAAFIEWEMDIVQNESGPFSGQLFLSKNAENTIYFYSARSNRRCYAKGHHTQNLILFTVLFPGKGTTFNGEVANGLRLFCNTQEHGLNTDVGKGFVSFSVGIDLELLHTWLEEEKINPPHNWNFHIDYSKNVNRNYLERYCSLIYRGLMKGTISVSQLKWMITNLLDHKSCNSIIRPAPNFNSIRLITDFIKERIYNSAPILLEDMIEMNGGVQRTFFYNFKKYTGFSPMKFVKNYQLAAAHSRLKRSDPLCTNVSDIAFELGFSHLGQFSQDFKELFGTNPASILGKTRYMS